MALCSGRTKGKMSLCPQGPSVTCAKQHCGSLSPTTCCVYIASFACEVALLCLVWGEFLAYVDQSLYKLDVVREILGPKFYFLFLARSLGFVLVFLQGELNLWSSLGLFFTVHYNVSLSLVLGWFVFYFVPGEECKFCPNLVLCFTLFP